MRRVGVVLTAGLVLVAASASSVLGEEKDPRFYLNPYLGAEQFERTNDFRFGGLYSFLSGLGGTLTKREDFRLDTDNTAISGGFSAGYWLTDRVGLELSFGTSHGGAARKLSITGGDFALFPAIGPPVQVGAVSSPAVLLLPTFPGFCSTCPPVQWKLDYDQSVFDIHLDARMRLWQSEGKGAWLEGILGFAYLRVTQQFDEAASGQSQNTPFSTIDTGIDLTDNLFGGRVGARGQYQKIWRNVTVMGEAFGEFYGRTSSLSAEQTIANANILVTTSGINGLPPTLYRARVQASDSGFVPRFTGKVRLAYDFADWGSLGFMYRFNALWNMSRPDAPTVISPIESGSAPILDHRLRISNDDRIFSHFFGLELAMNF